MISNMPESTTTTQAKQFIELKTAKYPPENHTNGGHTDGASVSQLPVEVKTATEVTSTTTIPNVDYSGFSIYNKDIDFYDSALFGKSGYNNNNNNNNSINALNNSASNATAKEAVTPSTKKEEPLRKNSSTTATFNRHGLDDLHNYSKAPEAIAREKAEKRERKPLPVASEDEEMDEDGDGKDVRSRGEEGDDKLPDHHARRPMNAFLIFCKRHRSIVRDRHPNLENRSITKILGDWWANLDKEEKSCYTELAKTYKDAFFSANPNFKWYKLPAPPLRTLSTRPSNSERSVASTSPDFISYYPYHHNNHTESSSSSRERYERNGGESRSAKLRKVPAMGVFKLADETQMGGLSSLLTESAVPRVEATIETTSLAEHAVEDPARSPWTGAYEEVDDESTKKSPRACKGKRYQEFMSYGKMMSPAKKVKTKHAGSELPTAAGSSGGQGSEKASFDADSEVKHINTHVNGHLKPAAVASTSSSPDKPKLFDASDFDLEEKIRALPALSLDEYLARKRETKKTKKKLGGRKTTTKPVKSDTKVKTETSVSGSQKRKAPKESITRRDVNNVSDNEEPKIIELPVGTPTSAAAALITLAEVAAQKATIESKSSGV